MPPGAQQWPGYRPSSRWLVRMSGIQVVHTGLEAKYINHVAGLFFINVREGISQWAI